MFALGVMMLVCVCVSNITSMRTDIKQTLIDLIDILPSLFLLQPTSWWGDDVVDGLFHDADAVPTSAVRGLHQSLLAGPFLHHLAHRHTERWRCGIECIYVYITDFPVPTCVCLSQNPPLATRVCISRNTPLATCVTYISHRTPSSNMRMSVTESPSRNMRIYLTESPSSLTPIPKPPALQCWGDFHQSLRTGLICSRIQTKTMAKWRNCGAACTSNNSLLASLIVIRTLYSSLWHVNRCLEFNPTPALQLRDLRLYLLTCSHLLHHLDHHTRNTVTLWARREQASQWNFII